MKNVDPLDHSWIVEKLGATQPTVHKAKYVAALSKRTMSQPRRHDADSRPSDQRSVVSTVDPVPNTRGEV
jgi:hypothetical protein